MTGDITPTQRQVLQLLARGFGCYRKSDNQTMLALEKKGLVEPINGFDGKKWEITNEGYSSLKRQPAA